MNGIKPKKGKKPDNKNWTWKSL